MNKRIRELVAQATKVTEPDDPDYRYEFFDKEKFAELIVRECADVAFKNVCYGNGEVGPESDILDHFGVKR